MRSSYPVFTLVSPQRDVVTYWVSSHWNRLSGVVYTGVASTGSCYLSGVVSLRSPYCVLSTRVLPLLEVVTYRVSSNCDRLIVCCLHRCCLNGKLLLIGRHLIVIALLCVVYTGVASTGRHPCGTHKEWIHGTTPFPPFFLFLFHLFTCIIMYYANYEKNSSAYSS